MKFKWKLFIWTMTAVALAYCISGSIMITSSFKTTYDKEVEIAREEHEIMQNSFIMVLSHLSKNVTDEVWRQVAKDLDDTSARENFYFEIQNSEKSDLYLSYSMRRESILAYDTEEGIPDTGAFLYMQDGKYLLMTRSYINSDNGKLYLNIIRDISDIFASRQSQLFVFYQIMGLIMVMTALVSYLIAYFLTKPLFKISNVAMQISDGNLSARANLEGYDEIGELAMDIDSMADSLEKSFEELNDSVRRQDDFVGNFAHELKTPLTSIIGYADMLRSRKMTEEEIFQAANYIFTEGKRLEAMSFKLLEMQVTKQQEVVLKDVDAVYLGDDIQGALAPLMEKSGMELKVDFEDGIIEADMDLIKSVIFNTVDNARKANEAVNRNKITITGNLVGENYIIKVSDEGAGIPKDEIEKITEAFYMVDKSRARKQGGAGLGLALCKQIVENHKGSLSIESQEGVGTSVTITLLGSAPLDIFDEEEEGEYE